MSAPFKRFTVHTTSDLPNTFSVYVSDLEGILALISSKDLDSKSTHQLSLERALFIERAIQKAIEEQP